MENKKYHNYQTCNKCGDSNEIKIKEMIQGAIAECSTHCIVCGFNDYWAYGFFESSQDGYDACDKY